MRLVKSFYLLFDELDGIIDVRSTGDAVEINDVIYLQTILRPVLLNASLRALFTGA